MKLKVTFAVLAVLAIVGILAGIKVCQVRTLIHAGQAGGPPPVAVSAAPVQRVTWETTLRSVGSVAAVEGTVVRAEVAGVVRRIAFEAGAHVAAGTTLVELDSAIERANLGQAQADAVLARQNLSRARELAASKILPQADLDQNVSRMAEVESRMASLQASLDKKVIKAPFGGELGVKRISVGQYLQPGSEIVSLEALDRVFVDFFVPQRELGRVAKGLIVRAVSDAHPDAAFEGRLTAIDPQVDPATRNARLQATFDNPGHRLRSGMYVALEIVLPEKRTITVVPATAVLYAPYGDTVFVLNESAKGLTVTQQVVRLGDTRGDFVEITEGLTGNERVVGSGAFKLRNGQAVVLSDVGTRPPSETPNPANS
jgi:membrane fusion protein, multidrug efflux system